MRLGFIGLGVIGRHMASCLQRAGCDLTVYDVVPAAAEEHLAAGAKWADSPADVAGASDVVFTSLPGPAEVEAVGDGLLEGFGGDGTWIELSTNSPSNAKALHERMAAGGVRYLEAPVSGGARGAAEGKLAIWVGGDKEVFDANLELLNVIGDAPFYAGPAGTGSVVKLVHNAAAFSIDCALAEVFSLGVKGGVEPLALWEAIAQGAVGRGQHGPLGNGSPLGDLVDQFLPGEFPEAGMRLTVGYKDISLATQMADELGVEMPLVSRVQEDFETALDRGWKDNTWRIVMRLAEERAGVDVAIDRGAVDAAVARYKERAAA
jgi:3-hydroxyisobutyrate dehydrogenase